MSVEVENRDRYPATSRYRNSRYYRREIQRNEFQIEPETWNPFSIPETAEDKYTKVQPGEEGRLDLISLRVYRTSALWWVIAFANDIIDPFGVVSQDTLRYPPFDFVASNILA